MEIDEQINQLVKLQLSQSTKKPSVSDKIASLATSITASGSLLAAGWAIYANIQTSVTQSEIEERQIEIEQRQSDIDLRQAKLDRDAKMSNENEMINALYFQRYDLKYKEYDSLPNLQCTSIPLVWKDKWDTYYQCLHGTALPDININFKDV